MKRSNTITKKQDFYQLTVLNLKMQMVRNKLLVLKISYWQLEEDHLILQFLERSMLLILMMFSGYLNLQEGLFVLEPLTYLWNVVDF